MNSAKRLASWRARNKRRQQSPEYRAKQSEWNRRWLEKNGKTPERLARDAELMRIYRNNPKHRHKHVARWKLNQAIASGRIVKHPCCKCGSIKSEAHHKDYSKPLDVEWLCRRHHREAHAKATASKES